MLIRTTVCRRDAPAAIALVRAGPTFASRRRRPVIGTVRGSTASWCHLPVARRTDRSANGADTSTRHCHPSRPASSECGAGCSTQAVPSQGTHVMPSQHAGQASTQCHHRSAAAAPAVTGAPRWRARSPRRAAAVRRDRTRGQRVGIREDRIRGMRGGKWDLTRFHGRQFVSLIVPT